MSNYQVTFYARDDLTFGRDESGHFTVTVHEGATPDTISIVDNDKGGAGDAFSGSTKAGETGQHAYGEANGTELGGESIQPLAALPGQENPDEQIMAIGIGSPVHTVGYGFTYDPVPGETVSFNYDDYISAPNYDSESLYVEGGGSASEGDPSDGGHLDGEPSGGEHSGGEHTGSGPSGGGSGPSSPPCFTRGTAIRTAQGEMVVESLAVGDMVWTESNGMQAIRWICQRTVPANGAFAPVRISAGTLGADRDICVSPAHRMLVKGPDIEVLFGVPKALVAAKDLVNNRTITRETTLESIEYFHIMFDQHEVLEAHGTLSESFFPHASVVGDVGDEQRKELFSLFPELEFGQQGYPVVYPCLMAHEMTLLSR